MSDKVSMIEPSTTELMPSSKQKKSDDTGAVASLRAQLNRIPSERQDEWLRMLYGSYNQRYVSESDRIWVTGAIMIPLSLGGFVALTQDRQPTALHLWLLALVSVILMVVWLVIAEHHRTLQQESKVWLKAIELILDIGDTGPLKSEAKGFNKLFAFSSSVQYMTWGLLWLEIVAWSLILLYWPRS